MIAESVIRVVYPSYRRKSERLLELETWNEEQLAKGKNDNVFIPSADFSYSTVFIRSDRKELLQVEGTKKDDDKPKIDVEKLELSESVDFLKITENYDWEEDRLKERTIYYHHTKDVYQVIAKFPAGRSLKYGRSAIENSDIGTNSGSHERKKGLKNALVSSGDSEGTISFCHLVPIGYHGSEGDNRLSIGFSSDINKKQNDDFEQFVTKVNEDYDIIWSTQIRRIGYGRLEWEYRISYNSDKRPSVTMSGGGNPKLAPVKQVYVMGEHAPLKRLVWKYQGKDIALEERLRESGKFKEQEQEQGTGASKNSTFRSGARSVLEFVAGVDRNGQDIRFDLANNLNPHLLVGGGTGSGKSVAINSWIIQIIKAHTPYEVQFIFIDPKAVEFGNYKGSPYCMIDPVTDMDNASVALNYICEVMDARARTFERCKVKNLMEYKNFLAKNLAEAEDMKLSDFPYIVCVIDEMKDLVDTQGDKIQKPIGRLAQKARSMGIHLIIASQKPSVDWLDSTLKSNLTGRFCYRVADRFTSTTVIGEEGGESLQGAGDCLAVLPSLSGSIIRNASLYFTEEEINSILEFGRDVYPYKKPIDYKKDMVDWGLAEYCDGWEDMPYEQVTATML